MIYKQTGDGDYKPCNKTSETCIFIIYVTGTEVLQSFYFRSKYEVWLSWCFHTRFYGSEYVICKLTIQVK